MDWLVPFAMNANRDDERNGVTSSPVVDNVARHDGLLYKRQISPQIGVYSTVDRV